ncbi:unnamed protein product [Ceutorhynchus assimilis]|uniref:Ribosome biogenesis protein SLX9 n=1 Tax=Ceutorhynchus assimilis TaxID=467358 RepID=A0A9N9QJG7_9CUCU|nr:unnamed protein product [Ceutorhynchus assimilis]
MGKIVRPKQKLRAKTGKTTGLDIKTETKLNAKSSVIMAKKEKIKMRRQKLLNKIDKVQQMKKALKLKEKRKSTAIMGDTNPLHDALPSLEALLKTRPSANKRSADIAKKKGIEKQRKRKREIIQGIQIYKLVLGNKKFLQDPWEAITHHVQAMVDHERQNIK